MGSPLTSADFRRLLQTDLREVADDIIERDLLASMVPTFFSMADSQKAWEEYLTVSDFGDIPEFTGELEYLPRYPGWHTKVEHTAYAAGVQSERQLVDDDQYGVIERTVQGMTKATTRTREKKGARIFQGAFSSAFDYQTNEEGKALCSTTHLSKSGASTSSGFSNMGTSAFSKANLEAARLLMYRFKTDIGERFEVSNNWGIVYPMALDSKVREVTQTPFGYNTAARDVNVEAQQNYTLIPYKLLDDTDTNDWFLVDLTAMKNALAWFDRIKPEYDNVIDFETKTLKHSVYFRLSWAWLDWRWAYGNRVS
jgi:hypothetical protein